MTDNETKYLTEQDFLDRMRDFRIANDKRYKFKAADDDQHLSDGTPVLGFEPSTVEGAMWLSI